MPRLCVKLCLEHEFLRDCLKHNLMQAELAPDSFSDKNPQQLLLGAFTSLVSSTVSKGQAQKEFQLETSVVWVAGRLHKTELQKLVDMASVTSTLGDASVKKASILLPGLTCAFESKQKAIAFSAEPVMSKEKMV